MVKVHPVIFPCLQTIVVVVIVLSLATNAKGAKSDFKCFGRNTGPRADPNNCHQYYMCIKGIAFTATCKPGTVFNVNQQKCLTGASVPCNSDEEGASLLGRKCGIEGKILPSLISCDKYLICRSRRYTPRKCPFGLIFHNKKFKCVVPPDPCAVEDTNELKNINSSVEDNGPYVGICDAKIGKLVAEPFDCSMYIKCEEDTSDPKDIFIAMKISECPTGQLFDTLGEICDDPAKVICGSRYRVVDPNNSGQRGRSIGSYQGNSTHPQSRNPKFGPEPGTYRAISRMVLTKTNESHSHEHSGEDEGHRNEQRAMGRSIFIKNDTERNQTQIVAAVPLIPVPVLSKDDKIIENTVFHDPHETYIGSPMILKFIMGKKRKSPVATLILDNGSQSDEHGVLDHDHQVHHPGVSKTDCALNKTTQRQRSVLPLQASKQKANSPKPAFDYEYYDFELSKESHEDETFGKISSRKNGTRGLKRISFIDEYQGSSLSKTLNTTADDVLYYNDDYYYMATSVEEITDKPKKESKSEYIDMSLEFTHHEIRRGNNNKKLPGKRKS